MTNPTPGDHEQGPQGVRGMQGMQGQQGIPGPMGGVPPGSVVITPEVMYRDTSERYGKIDAALGEIRSDLRPALATVAEHDAYINTLRAAGLPQRFGDVEREVLGIKAKISWAFGVGAGAAFLAGLLGAYLPRLLG